MMYKRRYAWSSVVWKKCRTCGKPRYTLTQWSSKLYGNEKWWKLHGNVSRNGYGNAVIGRYGGCFEEDSWLMCRRTRWRSPTELDVLAKYAPISMWERAMRSTEEARKIWKWKCQKPKLTMHFVYCKQLAASKFYKWLETLQEGS